MKTIVKNILIVIILLVSNVANAQFSYDTKECKDSHIRPVNKSEWVSVNGTKHRPAVKGSNPLIKEETELCSHFYGKAAVGVSYSLTHSKIAPTGELAFGYEMCFGLKNNAKAQIESIKNRASLQIGQAINTQSAEAIAAKAIQEMDRITEDHHNYSNLGLSFEVKAGITKMHGLEFEDLSTVKAAYAPYVGGNIYLHFNKHAKNMFSVYGGAAYTRLTSQYPVPESENNYVKEVGYNTISYEAGVQVMRKLSYGHKIGAKVFFNTTRVEIGSQDVVGVAFVYEINKVHKSKPITMGDWKAANQKINAARAAQMVSRK